MDEQKTYSQILDSIFYTGGVSGDFICLECKCRKHSSFSG